MSNSNDGSADCGVVEVRDSTLDEWLGMVRNPQGRAFWRASFPSERHRDEFFRDIGSRPEVQVKVLLRSFLISTGSNPIDEFDADWTLHLIKTGAVTLESLTEHQRRHVQFALGDGRFPVWEGLHWVVDLLPHHPRRALDVLDAFLHARAASLKDVYLYGLSDAQALIRAFYIAAPLPGAPALATLRSLSWREFEWLCGVLFDKMGFKVEVTERSNDDGVDVLAHRDELGLRERVAVSAKHRVRRLGKSDWRELLGTITDLRATRGVLVTSGALESGVRKKEKDDHRIAVIDGPQLVEMLNEHAGTDWHRRVD